jgi:outer membrane protein insertion porin family
MIRSRPAFRILAALPLLWLLLAGAAGAEGFKIVDIQVQGARRIKPPVILVDMKTHVGSDFDLQAIQDDVKAIWKTGFFTDVRFDSEEVAGGYRLTIIVSEKPIVARVSVEGNKEIDNADLKAATLLKERDLYQEDKVRESVRKMIELYHNKGFYDAAVESSVSEEADGSMKVGFRIREGEKVKISKIAISGNQYLTSGEIKKVIETKQKGFFSFITDSGTFKQDVLQTDILRIEALYSTKGFLDSKVSDPVITRGPDGLLVSIRIFEGRQYRVGDVSIRGESAVPADLMREKVKLKKSDVFDRESLVQDLQNLATLLKDKGYAEANVRPQVEKRKDYPLADVTYQIDQGTRFRFGRVEVAGNSKTYDRIARRQLEAVEGKEYSESALRESKENLVRTSFFKDVKVTTSQSAVPDEKDVKVDLQEGPTGTLSGGLGFSSVDKLFGVVQVSENNLFGRGWKSSLNSQFGARKTVFSLDFREPNLFDTDYSLLFNAYNSSTKYTDFQRKARGGKIGLGYNFTRFVSGSLSYRHDTSQILETSAVASSILKDEFNKGRQQTRSVSVNLTRNSTDRFIDPSRGSIQSAVLEYAGGPLGGSSQFIKYFLTEKAFFPVTESTVLSGNLMWGHVISTEGGARVPIFERFFLGGPYSVRGFKSRALSPADPNTGELYGGNKELVFNLEYVFPLMNDIGFKGVLFFDAGNTWRQGEWPGKDEGLRKAAGLGVRWYSPMGPLRFEWGWNLSPKPGESRKVAEFTIGTAF